MSAPITPSRKPTETKTEVRPETKTPDPHQDPVAYLLSKGWKCDGDPATGRERWFDPTLPDKPQDLRDALALPPRKLDNGRVVQEFQTVHIQGAWPISRQAALAVQALRDREAKKE